MRIGIELNGIVRDVNKQVIKYYKKDINPSFDDKKVNYNVLNIIDSLDLKSKKAKFEFMYVDYPYEIFGCAPTMDRHLSNAINNWIIDLNNREDGKYDLKLFSLKEEGLSIQSTYYFLGKIGCRVREMFFPKDGASMWDECDVIITTNENIVINKPEGKKVVLIHKDDISDDLKKKADYNYNSLMEVITDTTFIDNVKNSSETKQGFFNKLKSYFKK